MGQRRIAENSGDAEIAEFVVSVLIEKDILRLDIPVNNVLAVTQDQGAADVFSDFQNFGFLESGQISAVDFTAQITKQFHADQHIAAAKTAIFPVDKGMVQIVNNIGSSPQGVHHQNFLFGLGFACFTSGIILPF